MHTATHRIGSTGAQVNTADAHAPGTRACDDSAATIETRLWLPEYEWIASLSKAPENNFPAFRFPDLVSACISLVFTREGGADQLFRYLATVQLLRDAKMPRRDTEVWRPQFDQLQSLRRSPANRFPNPRFQLDHLATGCVALIQSGDATGTTVYNQARQNLKDRVQCASSVPG